MSALRSLPFLRACLCTLSIALASCGGGGGGSGSSSSGGGSSSSSGGTAPPPAVNRSPVLALPNTNQPAIYLHAFSYDVSQAGRTFTDPDGDTLRYEIKIGHVYNPMNDPNPPQGLRIEGTRIVGAPEEIAIAVVNVSVSDPAGQTASQEFNILVAANANPAVSLAPPDVIVAIGDAIDVDASMNGRTFADPDGDALTYEIALRGATGLSVNGRRVEGRLTNPGVVEVKVTARDAYGGSNFDVFQIAVPGPAPAAPALPLPAYIYNDEALPLPFVFRLSSRQIIPMWDMQFNNRATDNGAALGRVLFHDKRLSITNTISCATCHDRARGFASADRFSVGALGIPLARNTMALANVRYNLHNRFFSDMRAEGVREAARTALENPQEMGGTLALVESKVAGTAFYSPLFSAAFGTPEVTGARILDALAEYVNAIISYRTKFDRACQSMDNNPIDCSLVLNAEEMRGLELFQGSGNQNCSACHRLPSMGNEWQANNGLDAVVSDPGVTHPGAMRDGFAGKFRAASLRNIARSAPYMHDGRFATLREVIDHYDHEVKDSVNLDFILRDLTGAPQRLNLTESDKQALEAFLNTLTDDDLLADPRFADPFE